MAPPLIPTLLSKRSTNDPNVILIIIFAIVGGASVIISAIIIFVILKRRGSSVPRHSRHLSDTSDASLLRQKSQLKENSFTPPLDHSPISSDRIRRNDSTDSLATITPSRNEKAETQSREATPLLSSDFRPPKPTLPPLFIPSYSPHVPSHSRQSMEASSPGSASSGSLYSQPSASTSHVAIPPKRKPSIPRLLPPMVPRYAHIRPDTEDVPGGVDTRKIGKLLKERAKRNERKLTRGVSRIERAGSIKPVFGSDDSDDDDTESVYRPRHSKTKRSSAAALVPLRSSEEWSIIALV